MVSMPKSCSEHAKVALTNVSKTSEKILTEPMPVSSNTELLFLLQPGCPMLGTMYKGK